MESKKLIFYWCCNPDPFNLQGASQWKPYSQNDNDILESGFRNLQQQNGPSLIYLAKNYKVDLNSNMQINKDFEDRQRPVTYKELSTEESYFYFLYRPWINLNSEELKINIEYDKKNFKIGLNSDSLDKKKYIEKLIKELKLLNKESDPYYSVFIEKIRRKPKSLNQLLVQMYLANGFLWKEVNRILRLLISNSKRAKEIKYFYFGFTEALKTFGKESQNILKAKLGASQKNIKTIKAYKINEFTKNEVEYFTKYSQNKNFFISFNCFILATLDEKFVRECFDYYPYLINVIFEYEIDVNENSPFTFLGTKNIDLDNYEDSVLIHAGSVMQINSIELKEQNLYLIKSKLIF